MHSVSIVKISNTCPDPPFYEILKELKIINSYAVKEGIVIMKTKGKLF